MRTKISNIELVAVHSSLKGVTANAIVNEVDTHFSFKGAIAEDIISICGEEIIDGCLNKVDIPFTVGGVIVTDGYQHDGGVIHAVVSKYEEESDFYDICDAVKNVMLIAESNKFDTIALPVIGCCVGGMHLEDGVFIAMEVIKDVVLNASFDYLKKIVFCARNEDEHDVINDCFVKIFKGGWLT